MANGQSQCKECGCKCRRCAGSDHDVHLHVEIENLKQKLVERDSHIATMETSVLNEANKFPHGERAALQEELLTWQDKYRRLYEAHRRIQRVNQGLEDKLLRLVDVGETEKTALTKDVATLSSKLAEANYAIKKLSEDNERYKNDVALAIQFLQCKQGNFVSQKLDSLPNEVQAKVSSYVGAKRRPEERRTPPEVKSIKVPIPTFPPTAMVYSIPKAPEEAAEEPRAPCEDIVSAAIMAKVLEERERERAAKHCDTCTCARALKIVHDVATHDAGTQTGEYRSSVCLRCNGALDGLRGEDKSNVPVCAHDYDSALFQVSRPRAQVEPNNYLKEAPKAASSSDESARKGSLKHHHLCDKSAGFQSDPSAKSAKGPRYCSVRVQSGTRNILLDNVHNVAPVLYTHPHERKAKKEDKSLQVSRSRSFTSGDCNKKTQSCSSDDCTSVNLVGESIQNQQKVAEWIENNQVNMGKEPPAKKQEAIDPARYAEMENNVKKFLFGESQSEFLRKVAIGKQNYQNLRDYSHSRSRSNSRTETEI